MPYIENKFTRAILNEAVKQYGMLLKDKGNLNYFLHKLAKETCWSYEDYKNLEGKCQQALREIYRRLVAPYEDKKIKENGDVK